MKIKLITLGNKMPNWVQQGYEEYAKRLPATCELKLIEIPAEKRGKDTDLSRILKKEEDKILSYLDPSHHIVVLERQGTAWNTIAFSKQLVEWQQMGKIIDLVIGGPEGLTAACLKRAHQQWSISTLTLPHPLVRIVVAEQIYRAWSFLQNHPYHR